MVGERVGSGRRGVRKRKRRVRSGGRGVRVGREGGEW